MGTSSILEKIYNKIIIQADIVTFELDANNRMVYINSLYEKHFGELNWQDMCVSDREAVAGHIIHAEDIDDYMTLFDEQETDACRSVICRVLCKDNQYRWYRITICNHSDKELGDLTHKIGMFQNVNNELEAFRQIKDYEEYDGITGLYNENKFELEARVLIQSAPTLKYCVIVFDINKFRIINEVHGTRMGNKILKFVASIIRSSIPSNAICARLYTDNFAIFMPYGNKDKIIELVKLLYDRIANNPHNMSLFTSYGIFLADEPSKLIMQVSTMKDRALIAKSMLKKQSMGYYIFFSDEFSNEMIMEQDIEKNMYKALDGNQFEVYLQPKMALDGGMLVGAEALIRWNHPDNGIMSPDKFVPLFEKNGFIIKLDKYVCEEVCKVLNKWIAMGIEPVPISVNLSRLHIYNDSIVDYLVELAEKYRISPKYLHFEITETLFINNTNALISILGQLRDRGFKVEMDDFGSGYSSLNMLRNVPIDLIKIDKEFFDEKMSDNKGKIVISHTIAMAKDLNLQVLAEGVETEEHVQFLRDSKCDMVQGYIFSKPMTFKDFEEKFMSNE